MADIFFKCPKCDGQLVVDDRGAGLQLPCPYCEDSVSIPAADDHGKPENVNADRVSESQERKASLPQPRPSTTVSASTPAVSSPTSPPATVPAPPTHATAPDASSRPGGTTNPHALGRTDDRLDDLDWTDEKSPDGAESPLEDDPEIRRLAAMMHPDEVAISPGDRRHRAINFRCPSCGQMLSAKHAEAGDQARCTQCQNEVTIPDFRDHDSEGALALRRAKKASLPSGRNQALRTANDIRKAPSSPPPQGTDAGTGPNANTAARSTGNPTADTHARAAHRVKQATAEPSVISELDPDVQRILLKELQRLQAQKNREQTGRESNQSEQVKSHPASGSPIPRIAPRDRPPKNSVPPPTGRRRPPPPLAQHAEVVSSPENEPQPEPQPSPRRERRTRPSNEALPPLVTMDSMDLDSEVARQWGDQAVVPTRTLNWIAMVAIAALVAVGGFFGYTFFGEWMQRGQTPSRQASPVSEGSPTPGEDLPLRANPEVVGALERFLQATKVEEKAQFVRGSERLLPVMRDYYRMHPYEFESGPVDPASLATERRREGAHWFHAVTGEYQKSLLPVFAEFMETDEGNYLLDWRSWTGTSEISLVNFATKGSDEPRVLRVLVGEFSYPRYSYEDAAKYQCYLLRHHREDHLLYGYTEVGTPVGEEMAAVFRDRADDGPTSRVRLTLALEFASEFDRSKGQVLIRELVRDDWIEPPELD